MKKKVIFSAGGTGGHLFPAQTTAEELDDCEILFVAGGLSSNRYFNRERFNFIEIETATFGFSNPLKVVRGSFKIAKGISKSLEICKEFSPDLIIGFGSFFTLPMLMAAMWKKIPFILHEQNAIPGKVNRLFSRFSFCTAFTFQESKSLLKGKTVEISFPVRHKKKKEEYNLSKNMEMPILLVFGGSQGAKKINELLLQASTSLSRFHILHYTGNKESEKKIKDHYEQHMISHEVKAFEPNMADAFEKADVVISRAGASTIAELIEYEKPAVLIPYPHATENHQIKNARHFVDTVGGGEMCLEKELTPEKLCSILDGIFEEYVEKRQRIRKYKEQKQLKSLSQLIKEFWKNDE